MGSQPNPSPKVLFGPFEFEQLSGDLCKFGNRIRLQGKPLQILSILLEQPGQVSVATSCSGICGRGLRSSILSKA